MTDLLKGPMLKIERARALIEKIPVYERAAFSGNVYALVEDVDPPTGDRILKIKFVGQIPEEILLLVAEVVYHLRSSLDQLAVALARANGTTNTSEVYFPFAGSNEQFFTYRKPKRSLESFSPEAASIISRLQPYKGGNDFLWGISRLANVDKHSDLVPIGTIGNLNVVQNLQIVGAKVGLLITGQNRLDEGIPISNLGTRGKITTTNGSLPNFQISGAVAFGNVDVFQGQPVTATLKQASLLVDRIVAILMPHV